MQSDSLNTGSVIEELDSLIGLAEESSVHIDKSVKDYYDAILRYFVGFILGAGILVYSASALILPTVNGMYRIFGVFVDELIFWIVIVFASIIGLVLLVAGFQALFRMKWASNDIKKEKYIQEEIISLIDQQIKRVEGRKNISPVAMATRKIRIKRLDRTRNLPHQIFSVRIR